MLFIAEFGKHADAPDKFKAALDPHLEYLQIEKDKILLSATKHDPVTREALGFVWIIEAEDAEEAESLCHRESLLGCWSANVVPAIQPNEGTSRPDGFHIKGSPNISLD